MSRHPGWPPKIPPLIVQAGVVSLRAIKLRDATAWSRLRIYGQAYYEPWEPTGYAHWIDRHHFSAWPSLCTSLQADARKGRVVPLAIELNGEFCGQITVGNIVRGALCSAWIGYWVDQSVSGKGIATGATALGIDHAFGVMGLHRVEATVRPENVASQAVLQQLGFRKEGVLQRYLDVDGQWRDHMLYAITREELAGANAVQRLVQQGRAQQFR